MHYITTRNEDLTFAAKFTTDQTADIYVGSPTGTLTGAAAINSGKLEILDDNAGWLEYVATGNADSAQVGTILFKFYPNFTTAGTYGQNLFYTSKGEGDQTNQINLVIYDIGAGGGILLEVNDSANTPIVSALFPSYAFVEDAKHVMQLNYDFTLGKTELYINGVKHGTTQAGTGIRNPAEIGIFRYGVGWDIYSSSPSNFSMDDLCIFKTVQAPIDDYTIGYEFDFPSSLSTRSKLYGFIYDANAPIADVEIKIRPYQGGFANTSTGTVGAFHQYAWTSLGTTYNDGYFEGYVYIQPATKYWELKIGSQSYTVQLADQAANEISDLTLTAITD